MESLLELEKRQVICISLAWFYVNPIPSFRFWSGRKNQSRLCKSKQASGAKSDAEMVLGSFVCSCGSAIRFLDIQNSSQRRLLLYVWRALSALRSTLDSCI